MRVYVTGGTGLVGSNVIRLAREKYHAEIIAAQYGPEPEWVVDYELDPLDIRDSEAIRRSIQRHKPDVVVHAAILLDLIYLNTHRAKSWAMTVGATQAFASTCREIGARLIFVSTDWVFDGTQPMVDEDSPPMPVNFYGLTKVVCERELGAMDDLNYAVARLAGVYGLNYANPSLNRREQGLGFELAGYIAHRITRGQVAPIWTGPNVNEVAHATLASDAADLILRLAGHTNRGIFHCFGSEAISRVDFAHEVARTFGADHGLIATVPTDAQVLAAHADIRIPFRIRASVDKTAAALGRYPLNVRDGLQAYQHEWAAQMN